MRVPLLLVLALIAVGISCANQTSPSMDIVRANGTVTYMSFEGGFWAIAADNGTNYDPLGGLPVPFQQQGLRVWFEGRIRNDMGGIHMNGPIIEIINIRRL